MYARMLISVRCFSLLSIHVSILFLILFFTAPPPGAGGGGRRHPLYPRLYRVTQAHA